MDGAGVKKWGEEGLVVIVVRWEKGERGDEVELEA